MPFAPERFVDAARYLHTVQPLRTKFGTSRTTLSLERSEIRLHDEQHTAQGFLKADLTTVFDPLTVISVRTDESAGGWIVRIDVGSPAETAGSYGGRAFLESTSCVELALPSEAQRDEFFRRLHAAFF